MSTTLIAGFILAFPLIFGLIGIAIFSAKKKEN